MKYGIDRIGYYQKEKCTCGWEGNRSELNKDYIYEEDTENYEFNIIDEHWVCPICKSIIID